MSHIRCFIAIEMGPAVRQALAQVSELLSEQVESRAVRWVKPANIHLTLRFLGDTDPAAIIEIGESLDDIVSEFASFELGLAELGCFPNPRKPRVIWIGVGGDVGQLVALQQSVAERLARLGWEREGRRYQPHLTLGRVKDTRQVVESGLPWGKDLSVESFEVAKIRLIQSDLRPAGAVYTTRHESRLSRSST
jgi:2'-5' RNA ligase